MSGHSKWSKVKHQKAVTDVIKAKHFTKASRDITMAVIAGGGVTDPSDNFHLRLAIEKGRSVNMPRENIERAIAKAKWGEGSKLEEIVYEGYAPFGVAVLCEVASDNRTRCSSQIKNIFDRYGGSLGAPGSVGYLFSRLGLFVIEKQSLTFDDVFTVAVTCDCEDVSEEEEAYVLWSLPQQFFKTYQALTTKQLTIIRSELVYRPETLLQLDEDKKHAVESMVEALESLDDVQKVTTNLDI